MNRTASMRAALRDRGALMSNDLAAAAGVEPRLVSSLLRWDMNKGRIAADRLEDGRMRYRLVDEMPAKVAAAVRFLEGRGYRVVVA